MVRFERIKRYENDESIHLPTRATSYSAGYDFEVAEDTVIPPYMRHFGSMLSLVEDEDSVENDLTLNEVANLTKKAKARPTLVPTGIKCKMEPDMYLELTVRSSSPLKHWLVLANGEGIIDSDYYSNSANDGHIYFQIINFSPYFIKLQKGEKIGQGIIKRYLTSDEEIAPSAGRSGGLGSTSE